MDLNQIAKALGPRSSEMQISISFPPAWKAFPERRITISMENADTGEVTKGELTLQQYAEVLHAALHL